MRLYSNSWMQLESNHYLDAKEGFQSLGDYKDSILMVIYCSAREWESYAAAAYDSDHTDEAVNASQEAYVLFSDLSFYRDCDTRAAACREQIFSKASEWMRLDRFKEAADAFAVLDSWQDSDKLKIYCEASDLEKQGSYIDAANLFSEIPDLLDSGNRAVTAKDQAYRLALEYKTAGNYESAANAFDKLGDYQDSEKQAEECTALLVRTFIQSGAYAEALQKYSLLSNHEVFPEEDISAAGNLDIFLDSFINVWMNAHAGVMNAFFSCNLLQPYLEPGGELDTLLRENLTDGDTPLNYNYIYYGKDILEYRILDSDFSVVQALGRSSYVSTEGLKEVEDSLFIMIDSRKGTPLVAAVLPAQVAKGAD